MSYKNRLAYLTIFSSWEIYWSICVILVIKEHMSKSYRKTPVNCPAHAKLSNIGKLSWKKALRRKMNNCCDSDGTPVLPAKISLCCPLFPGGSKKRQNAFGYGTYANWVYKVRHVKGRLVAVNDCDWEPVYTARQLRMYYHK